MKTESHWEAKSTIITGNTSGPGYNSRIDIYDFTDNVDLDMDDFEILANPHNLRGGEIIHLQLGSTLMIDSLSVVKHKVQGSRWDGFKILGIGDINHTSTIKGQISGIHEIYMSYSNVIFDGAVIHDIGALRAIGSNLVMKNNAQYYGNDSGIYVLASIFDIDDSIIAENLTSGIIIEWSDNKLNRISNSLIYFNMEHGVYSNKSFVHISDTVIHLNEYNGIFSTGLTQSRTKISGNTQIIDNRYEQVKALETKYPEFRANAQGIYPTVSADSFTMGTPKQYLLSTVDILGRDWNIGDENFDPIMEINYWIHIHAVNISQVTNRYFPSKGKYILCNNQLCSYLFLYHEAYEKMLDGEYDITLDLLMQIIDTDEETPYKMNSILLLPYVYRALDLDADELMMIYDNLLELGDEDIGIAVRYALPLLNILYEDYAAAVFNLSAIIEDPYTEAEELLAILDQAWCILKLMDLGLRSMPEGAVFQSMTHKEYRELEKEIFARVYGLENKEEETEKLPEIYELSAKFSQSL